MAQKPLSGIVNVSCHAWNADMSMIALSPNSTDIYVYKTTGSTDNTKWTLVHTLTEVSASLLGHYTALHCSLHCRAFLYSLLSFDFRRSSTSHSHNTHTPTLCLRRRVCLQHSEFVSSIDWSPVNNMIVSCSHDRNAYVWQFDAPSNTWKPTLVILRINRSATFVRWSPAGNKFAVGSGAKCVPVCQYQSENNYWTSQMIKKHKSTVLTLAWCPNNKFLVTGSSDKKCRIFSAYIEGVDDPNDDGFGEVWPNQHKFGDVLCEFDQAEAWVQAVSWSPAGFRVCFAGHGSSQHFVQILSGGAPVVQVGGASARVTFFMCVLCTLRTQSSRSICNSVFLQSVHGKTLPLLQMEFLDDNTVVGVGFDRNPIVYKFDGKQWAESKRLDEQKAVVKAASSNFGSARAMWGNKVDKGSSGGSATETKLNTIHQNTIVSMCVCPDGKTITTSGLDGRVLSWPRPS
jgi:actin related protein 2/3 complex subunit 1A/1B